MSRVSISFHRRINDLTIAHWSGAMPVTQEMCPNTLTWFLKTIFSWEKRRILCFRCVQNIDFTDNNENFQRLYLALEAVTDDHREYGSAGEGSLWSRLAVYVEAVLKNLFIELSMQVKRSDWSIF